MSRLLTLFLCISAFLSQPGFSEEVSQKEKGAISGKVIHKDTRDVLIGAEVLITGDEHFRTGAVTDAKGAFLIKNLPVGEARIHISYLGFQDYVGKITIEKDQMVEMKAALTVSAISLHPLEIIGRSAIFYQELPGTATLLSAKTVEQINPIGTQELLEYVPGVNGYADDGIGNSRISIGIRGLNPRRSSRVLVLEDGAPIQPAIYVYSNMYYNPPAERIDRVEVIKGSAAIKHGPQTMGGVVNYVTRRPRQQLGGFVRLTGGSNGFSSAFAEIGGWGGTKVHPELQLLVKRGDGFRENNAFQQYNGTFKLHILPTPKKAIYIKANVNSEIADATYTGLTEYSFRTNPRFNPKENDEFKVFRTSLDVNYRNQISQNFSGNTKAFISYFDRRWWRENDIFVRASQYEQGIIEPTFPEQVGDLVRIGNGQDNFGILRTFYVVGASQSYSLKHSLFGKSAQLEVGGRIYWERFVDDKKTGNAPDARDGIYFIPPENDEDSPEIVGQSHHYETFAVSSHISEKITFGNISFSPGLRFEVFEQQRIDRLRGSVYQDKATAVLLPGIGANYNLGNVVLFAGIHRGFTPPSSGALQIASFGENVADGGLDLEAEKSWNSEVGLRGNLSWMAFEAAVFNLAIEDMVAAARGTAFRNLGKVNTRGLEIGGSFFLEAFTPIFPDVHFSYALLDTEIKEGIIASALIAGGGDVDIAGNELAYAPRHTLTAGLTKKITPALTIRGDLRYVSEVFTDYENIEETFNRGDTGPISAYTILNASIDFKLNKRWQWFAAGKNLLDEIYIGSRLHSNPRQKAAGLSSGILPGPRRQVNMGFRYTF